VAKPDLQPVNLGSIARGALMELFEIEIAKLAANIADTKTKATKERRLTLELSLKPDQDRKTIDVTTRASLKLAPIADHASRVYLGKDTDGHPLLFDTDPRQELLFEPPAADKPVLQFGGQKQ
jgi:hypothetical protein